MFQTLESRRDTPDSGLQIAESLSHVFGRMFSCNQHRYAPVYTADAADLSSCTHELETQTSKTALKPKPKRKATIPFRKIWTPGVLTVLGAHFLLATRMFLEPSFFQITKPDLLSKRN